MKRIILILSFALLGGALEIRAQCRGIRILRGRISTVIKGITTKDYVCYRIRARFGQKISLHLASPDKRVSFSLQEDHPDAGFTARDVRAWKGELANATSFLMDVGGGGKARLPFTLEITIR